ncbi:PhzF family phenazine biosynthesis protein [Thalassotalea sp. PS06]|uniref:PhzF family phenazine biosynthesis protein n=1 Tax=Thalassotalea sp. PS06 TaxID=2594005 RepID=UPI001161F02E|nr:PhzF family phenazine biosynthesis protein [Thalassotalea sp. PS06]QDP01305.1 PhzF family phenazine biosynthesis protein [Thalassotalea sp. PS06]
MQLPIYIINAFTDKPFSGNPAAVVPLDEWLEETQMQQIASQNNLSETAFVKQTGPQDYHIRWFSPLTEIDFCGHASLASAFMLFNYLGVNQDVSFYADAVGKFIVAQKDNGLIEMTFEQQIANEVMNVPQALLCGLSAKPERVYRNRQAYIAVFDSESTVRTLTYDCQSLKRLAPYDVCVTAPGDHVDFVSRYFWPANGGDEDPVTGSIHSALAPYWSKRLGKEQLVARQVSGREGLLYCNVIDDKVKVAGHAAPFLQGTLTL